MKTKAFEYEVKKQLGNSCSIDGLLARCKNYPLSKAMVDHDHDRIKSRGRREIGDEVNRELLKGESDDRFDGKQRRCNGMSVNLVLLANGAASDEVFDEGGKTRPPEIPLENGLGLKDPHMPRQRGSVDGVE